MYVNVNFVVDECMYVHRLYSLDNITVVEVGKHYFWRGSKWESGAQFFKGGVQIFVYMVVFDVEAVLKNAKLPIIERLKFFLNLKFRIFSISCQQWWEQMKKLR